mgnify:CR=1 FL=1
MGEEKKKGTGYRGRRRKDRTVLVQVFLSEAEVRQLDALALRELRSRSAQATWEVLSGIKYKEEK